MKRADNQALINAAKTNKRRHPFSFTIMSERLSDLVPSWFRRNTKGRKMGLELLSLVVMLHIERLLVNQNRN